MKTMGTTTSVIDPKIYENEIKELNKKLDAAEEQVIILKELLIKLVGEKYGVQI